MDEEGFPFPQYRDRALSPSPSVESLASAHTRASYSHDYASDDYESDDDDDDDANTTTINNNAGDGDGSGSNRAANGGASTAPSSASHSSSSSSLSLSRDSSPSSRQQRRPNLASQRFATSSNSSIQNFFGPPFYGRPPTPLPPSPSLTSLLRPSRPTTPDGSDDDAGHAHASLGAEYRAGGPTAPNHQAEAQDPVRKSSPRVPTYEYYGFILYMFSTLSFGLYLLWAFLPSPFLHALGIHYYPNRWWALAVPSFLVACVVYIYVALAAYNTEMLTVRMASVEAMVDGAANIAVIDSRGRIRGQDRRRRPDNGVDLRKSGARGMLDWRRVWSEGTDAVMDIPLAGVCEVLYGDGD